MSNLRAAVSIVVAALRRDDTPARLEMADELVKAFNENTEQVCTIADYCEVTVGDDGTWLISLYDFKKAMREGL